MSYGVTLLIVTGLCWVLIAVVISMAARKQLDLNYIQALSALLCVVIAGVSLNTIPRDGTQPGFSLALTIFAAGVGNYLMIKLMNTGMARGHNGIVWGITQSALILPFLMGIFFFGVMPTATRCCGVGLILLAIILFSRVQSTSKHEGRYWLLPTLGAFLCAGASQCCANFPSYAHHAQVSCLYRLCWTQLGVFATFAIDSLLTRKKWRPQGTLLPVLILSAVNVVSLPFFFYRGLNIVAQCGSGSIGYPIAIGTSIAGFFMYSRMILRERINGISLTGLLAVLLGIIIISMA